MSFEDFLSNFKVTKIKTVMDGKDTIQIIESKNRKVFNFNHITYSMLDKRSIYTGYFWDYFLPAAFVFERPKVLILGYGCGTVAYQLGALLGDKVEIDGVELSKTIANLAKSFVPKAYGNVIVGDALDYVRKSRDKYDLLIFDIYANSQIPKEFLSDEFIDHAHRILGLDGLLLINYMMSPMNLLRFGGFKNRLKKRFWIYSVKTSSLGDSVMLVCSKRLKGKEILSRISKKMALDKENAMILRHYSKIKSI